jgi:metal-dependent amidase/aminoacylase/carboxypeptidase family protein
LQAQQIVSRFANPIVPTVLTFGKIESQGGATNVIPSIVEIQGTFRTYNEGWRQKVHHHLEVLAKSLSDFYECQIELNIVIGYPFLNNDEKLTQVLIDNSKNYFQADDIVSLDMRPTADDFAFYSQHKKSCFYRIGVGNKAKGIVYGVHHPKFAIDDAAYSVAIKSLASNVICLLDK